MTILQVKLFQPWISQAKHLKAKLLNIIDMLLHITTKEYAKEMHLLYYDLILN